MRFCNPQGYYKCLLCRSKFTFSKCVLEKYFDQNIEIPNNSHEQHSYKCCKKSWIKLILSLSLFIFKFLNLLYGYLENKDEFLYRSYHNSYIIQYFSGMATNGYILLLQRLIIPKVCYSK